MRLSKADLVSDIRTWLQAWDKHDLDGVMALMHDDVVFENWNGQVITGKQALRLAWTPWFLKHNNFRFHIEDIFVDEADQKALFRWRLEWLSLEVAYKNEPEIRRGVDVLHFHNGKIREKITYSKTALSISGQTIQLQARST